MSSPSVLSLIAALNGAPTATFHEDRIYGIVWDLLEPLRGQPHFSASHDRFGNLALSYRPEHPSHEVVLVAHTDHPAFEVIEDRGSAVTLRILGGVPLAELPGGGLRIGWGQAPGEFTSARVTSVEGSTASAELTGPRHCEVLLSLPAVHDLLPPSVEDGIIYAPVIDDVVGCALALGCLFECFASKPQVTLTVLLTRAEEEGFLGALKAIEAGLVNQEALVLSLEASSVLAHVRAGEGPVIRTGDRGYLFDANVLAALERAGQRLAERNIAVRQQRMTGGICEGSLFLAYGYAAAGLAIPLLNYHNRGAGRIDREGVAVSDVEGGLALLNELVQSLPGSEYRTRGSLRHRIDTRARSFTQDLDQSGEECLGQWW